MISHNKNNTTNENHEGTLTKCLCGEEFYLSFENGFKCDKCKSKNKVNLDDDFIKKTLSKYIGEDK